MNEYLLPYYTIVKCPYCDTESKMEHRHKIPNGKLSNCKICRRDFLVVDNNIALNVGRSD